MTKGRQLYQIASVSLSATGLSFLAGAGGRWQLWLLLGIGMSAISLLWRMMLSDREYG